MMRLFYFDETGGGLVEYALTCTLIALAAVAAMTNVGTKIIADITSMVTNL